MEKERCHGCDKWFARIEQHLMYHASDWFYTLSEQVPIREAKTGATYLGFINCVSH
jgi:hypothetical protein